MLSTADAEHVAGPRKEAPIDYLTLAEFLDALSYPVRLALLDALRFPHTAREVRVPPHRIHRGTNPERALSRQTIQSHLDKLVEQGLVHAETVEREGKPATFYTTNPARLYAMTEELRRLSLRYAGRGHDTAHTGTLGSPSPPSEEKTTGPRLTLVHGVYEGKVFSLHGTSADGGRWSIGRKRDAHICLEYDPYVSTVNAYLERAGGQFVVHDVAESKNGTRVNWFQLPRGGSKALAPGDLVGVGRSLLLFLT